MIRWSDYFGNFGRNRLQSLMSMTQSAGCRRYASV